MLKRNAVPLLLVCLLAPLLSGCFYSREISHVRRDLERQYPAAHFDREVVVQIGPSTIRTLGWIAGRVPEEEAQMASDYLREIHRIKVGVYHVEDLPPLDEVDLPHLRRFERDGWEVAVTVREDDEVVWVLYREWYDSVRDLYVLVLNEDELVIASVQGRLDALLQQIVEDHGPFTSLLDGVWN